MKTKKTNEGRAEGAKAGTRWIRRRLTSRAVSDVNSLAVGYCVFISYDVILIAQRLALFQPNVHAPDTQSHDNSNMSLYVATETMQTSRAANI